MRAGSRGEHVRVIQQQINETGVTEQLSIDGVFGPLTEQAVKALQRRLGMDPTGEVDHGLSAALRVWDTIPARVTGSALREAAYRLKVDYPAVAAIVAVESKGQPFLTVSERPVILFERHIMRRRLLLRGLSVEGHPENIVNSRPGGYRGGEREWDRFDLAEAIHWDCAIESCSWGLFQIMGFHWSRLGYIGAENFAERMHQGVEWHIDAFIRFLEADPVLLQALREHRWAAVAHRYNGPNYKINRYDERLRSEYEAIARMA